MRTKSRDLIRSFDTAGHAGIKACGEVSSGFEWLKELLEVKLTL